MIQQNTSIFAQLGKREALLLLTVGAIFVFLSLGSIVTRAPWCDEAYFGEPPYRLSTVGQLSTLVVPPSPQDDPKTFGTDRYTFYAMPLDLILQAGWYKLAGFGIVQQRVLSLAWGLVALGSWWVTLKYLGANPLLRVTAVTLLAVDYTFVRASADGRMDMMSAALGTLGLALFLALQQRSYTRAVLAATCCSAASAFTHPIGGLIATATLGIAMLWFSRGRFRVWHVALAAVPYLIFAAGWTLYILQAPDVFHAQFSSISEGRLSAWKQPVAAVLNEWRQRWAGSFGLASGGGAKRLKIAILALYAGALVWALVRFRRLVQNGLGLLPVIALVSLFILCYLEGTKSAAYLIHAVPVLAVLAAVLLNRYWRPAGSLIFAAVVLIQLAGTGYTITRSERAHEYDPVVAFLKDHPGDVTGVASLGYGLGFEPRLTDDRRLGYFTHHDTRYVVIDNTYRQSYEQYRSAYPEFYRFVEGDLAKRHQVFSTQLFTIYEK